MDEKSKVPIMRFRVRILDVATGREADAEGADVQVAVARAEHLLKMAETDTTLE